MFTRLFVSASLLASCIFAQSTTVSGLVKDTNTGPVPKAAVNLTNTRTGVASHSATNDVGLFLMPPVEPGDYELTAEAPGFGLSKVAGIKLEVGAAREIRVTLQPKQVSESVTVTAAAPELQTETADRGNVVESHFVENVPLNVRNPLQLINFAQGVTQANSNASGTNVVSQSYTNTFRINGSKSMTTEILLDGAANTVAYANQAAAVPSVDAV